MNYEIIKIRESFWAINQNGVRSFLIEGTDSALLIDTCFGGDIKSVCETLTDKPITLITTHADGDHTGDDAQFEVHYMHPTEFDNYFTKNPNAKNVSPAWEGDIFDLGNYTLEVVLIPGHTPGSIALLERNKHFIITGDTLQFDNNIFMFGEGRNIEAFLCSLKKLEKMYKENTFNTAYSSHGKCEISADIIYDEIDLVTALINGKEVSEYDAPDRFPNTVKVYQYKNAKILFEK